MASASELIVNLNDESHPNFELSKLNNESPLFKVLPPEIRLMIYEFAVYVDETIQPIQAQCGSNKFIRYQYPRVEATGEFTTVVLARTCRAIYAELACWNPFYRVNTFHFRQQTSCLTFLAAITPKRRQQVQSIDLKVNGWALFTPRPVRMRELYPLTEREAYLMNEMTVNPNLLAMLSQCSLRFHRFRVELDFQANTVHEIRERVAVLLRRIRDPMRLPGSRLMWDLPFFRCQFLLDGQNFGHLSIMHLQENVNRALRLYRDRLGRGDPQWLKEIAKNNRLQEDAVAASSIEFPGEVRVQLNKGASSIGRISSRTRAKCRTPNSMGVVERTVPRYNEEGTLISYAPVSDVRWNNGDVQFRVTVYPGGRMAWEDLTVLFEPRHEQEILEFYRRLLSASRNTKSGLDPMKDIPTPHYIFRAVSSHWVPGYFRTVKEEQTIRKRWRFIRDKWDSALKVDDDETD